jgi:hypothetical protein
MATVDEALAELAAVPLREFVKARGALAGRLRKEGAAGAAKTVAALKRPPTAVWAVNRLAREAGESIASLIEATDHVRAAHLGRGESAGALTPAIARQRGLVGELMRRAERVLREGSIPSSAEVLRRIETTLVAAASDPKSRAALRQGRLEHELAPLGFDVFGGAAPGQRDGESAQTSPRQRAADRDETSRGETRAAHGRKRGARDVERERARARHDVATDPARHEAPARRQRDDAAAAERARDDGAAERRGARHEAVQARQRQRAEALAERQRRREQAATELRKQRDEAARQAAARRAEALAEIERRTSEVAAAVDRVRQARDDLERSTKALRDATRVEEVARRSLADAKRRAKDRAGRA